MPPSKLKSFLALVLGLAASAAQADIVWNWSLADDIGTFGSGQFVTAGTTPAANTPYSLVGGTVSGTLLGSAITGLANNGVVGAPTQSFQWDGGTGWLIDESGITFSLASGHVFTLYRELPGVGEPTTGLRWGSEDGIERTVYVVDSGIAPVQPVPEPSTWLMGVAGLAVLATRLRRRRSDPA